MSIPSLSSNETFIFRGKEISEIENWSEFASNRKGLEDSRKRKKKVEDKRSRGDSLKSKRDKG